MKRRLSLIILFFRTMVSTLAFCLGPTTAFAQSAVINPSLDTDASWAKVYATSCSNGNHPCPPSSNGYENAFNGDSRLPGLLRHSLPQHESWWLNGHGGSAPVSSIVQQFMGVPKDFFVDTDRYVTATGCVPHDCLTNGMLWIDTHPNPARLIFVAEVAFGSKAGGDHNHLWIYASAHQNFSGLPPDFLKSLRRWHKSISTKQDPQSVTVATLVEPNGIIWDLTYDQLFSVEKSPVDPEIGKKH